MTDEDKINYFRYQAIRYLNEELQEQYYEKAVLVSKSLASIMKTLMVKRLESSFTAFRISLHNLLVTTQRMISMFNNGKVFIAPDLKINDLMEKGFSMEQIENLIIEMSIENPRNNIFEPEDFDPAFLIGLKKDEQLLKDLEKEWKGIEDDPKLTNFLILLKQELFRKDMNPTGKLVVFTESTDTANYLEEKLKDNGYGPMLSISSENRRRFFEIIQENFDANYEGKQKDDFSILITTDILAEGINLHRSNVIVNYDTPWNATRLMQRIGRVNRIGSIAEVIYNYSFYPSQQGDEEINLYNNALVKLQGFHSAFGEDAQIYTHEELVEQFELFEQGVPGDEDKRLYYLRFIRAFKDNNPKEFKRLKHLPPKSRTGRSVKECSKPDLKDCSIIFLKSPYKMEFYSIDPKNKVSSLTFIDTAAILEATSTEMAHSLPDTHYSQVQSALSEFEKDFLSSSSETVTTTEKADAISMQANKFLRDIKGISKKDEVKKACENLRSLIDLGTHTPLPNEIRKVRMKLDKRQVTLGQAENMIILVAKKYDALNDIEDIGTSAFESLPANIEPEIVISETFFG